MVYRRLEGGISSKQLVEKEGVMGRDGDILISTKQAKEDRALVHAPTIPLRFKLGLLLHIVR